MKPMGPDKRIFQRKNSYCRAIAKQFPKFTKLRIVCVLTRSSLGAQQRAQKRHTLKAG